MNTTKICIHCGQPLPEDSTARRKFCKDACKMAFQRAPHSTYSTPPATPAEEPLSPEILAKFSKSKPSKHQPPPKQPPTNEQLLTNCWKHLPPHIAAYMPVQPHQTLQECLQIEAQRRGVKYEPAPAKPTDPQFQPGNPIPFQLDPTKVFIPNPPAIPLP